MSRKILVHTYIVGTYIHLYNLTQPPTSHTINTNMDQDLYSSGKFNSSYTSYIQFKHISEEPSSSSKLIYEPIRSFSHNVYSRYKRDLSGK